MQCVMCGVVDSTVKAFRLISEEEMTPEQKSYSNGQISACKNCATATNIGLFVSEYIGNRDELTIELIRLIFSKHKGDNVPSYETLANTLNAMGYLTKRGKQWGPINLRARLLDLGIQKDELFERRAPDARKISTLYLDRISTEGETIKTPLGARGFLIEEENDQ